MQTKSQKKGRNQQKKNSHGATIENLYKPYKGKMVPSKALLPENKQNDLPLPTSPAIVFSTAALLSTHVLPATPPNPLRFSPRVRRRREIRGAMWRSCVSRGLSRAKASASRLFPTASVLLIYLTPLDRSGLLFRKFCPFFCVR